MENTSIIKEDPLENKDTSMSNTDDILEEDQESAIMKSSQNLNQGDK